MNVSACVLRARAVVFILALALATSVQANQSSDGIRTDVAAGDALRGSQETRQSSVSVVPPPTLLGIAPPPVIDSVTPDSGPAVGGTAVTISGSAFQAGASASFGAAACTDVVVNVPDTITCNTPSGALGLTSVTVANPDGQLGTLVSGYEYLCLTDPVVTSDADSGAGSLRQAIADACAGSTITFAGGLASSNLTTDQLLIDKNLTIDGGAGVSVTRVAGSPNFRIFSIDSGTTVSISGLRISNGSTTGNGGGIFSAGTLALSNCAISGNSAGTNFGGGLWSQGPAVIDRCTISGNQAGNGGGLFHGFNTLTMSNTTVSDNTSTFQAGGVNIQDATATLVNCTISGNRSELSQAGIAHLVASRPASSLTLRNCTVTDNVGPVGSFGGVWTAYFTDTPGQTLVTRLENTLVTDNSPDNFTTTTGTANTLVSTPNAFLESMGHNLDSDGTSGFVNGSNGDLIGTTGTPINALLAPLGTFGGPTQTHALLPGSPALNAGDNAACAAGPVGNLDQRGVARPQQATCDIGAFESRGFNLAISGGNNQIAGPGLAFANPLSVTVTPVAANEPVDGGQVTFTPPGAGATAGLTPNPATITAGTTMTSATANGVVGSYQVAADASGASAAVNFTLTNAVADLGIDDVTLTEGDSGTSDALFTVTRSSNLTAFSVPFSMTAGTAQEGTDYLATSGVLNFVAGGALTQTISVPVIGDLVVETGETATLNLGTVTDIAGVTTITEGSGLLAITDNDSALVTFDPISVSQSEAVTPMVFTVTLSNPVQSGVVLALNSALCSATAADFTPIGDAVVTFPANSTAGQTVNVSLIDDALNENDESFRLTLSGLTAVGDVTLGAAAATGTIVDDDPLPQIVPVPVFNRWGLMALILMMLALPVLVRRSAA